MIIDGKGILVALGKGVSDRRSGQIRWHAGDAVQRPTLCAAAGQRPQKAPGVGMSWVAENFLYQAGLYDFACIHDGYAVRHCCHHAKVVGDKEDGKGKLHLQPLQKL